MRLGAQVAAPPHFLVVEWWCLTTTLTVKLTDLRLTTVRFDEGVRGEEENLVQIKGFLFLPIYIIIIIERERERGGLHESINGHKLVN